MVVLSQPSATLAHFSHHLGSPYVTAAHQVIKKQNKYALLYALYTNNSVIQYNIYVLRFLLCGRFICAISLSNGQRWPFSWQDVPEWLLPLPLWLLLQQQRSVRANWTLQPRCEIMMRLKQSAFLYYVKPPNTIIYLFTLSVFPQRCLIVLSTTGYFCSLGSSEPSPVSKPYGDVCPPGHFCPKGSGSPTPCPVGGFLPEPRASSPSHCRPCPPGKHCLNPGSSQPTGQEFHHNSNGLDTIKNCQKFANLHK